MWTEEGSLPWLQNAEHFYSARPAVTSGQWRTYLQQVSFFQVQIPSSPKDLNKTLFFPSQKVILSFFQMKF